MGWGNATGQGAWNRAYWNREAWNREAWAWTSFRRAQPLQRMRTPGRWTALDVALAVGALWLGKEVLVAFVALKLWHQASRHEGSVLAFAGERWDSLVRTVRRLVAGRSISMPFVSRTSGNHAFDAWREAELSRIEAERSKLRNAEREFAAYRDELLHAKDREDFDRFMRARDGGPA